VAVVASKDATSSPSITGVTSTLERSSSCHSKNVLDTFSEPTLDVKGVSSGAMLLITLANSSRIPLASKDVKVFAMIVIVYAPIARL
jgi:hypothetical protein